LFGVDVNATGCKHTLTTTTTITTKQHQQQHQLQQLQPLYFSPELCNEEPYNFKSDIWALGCLLYELVTFHPPFVASNQLALARKIVHEQPEPLRCSTELHFLCTKMLEKDMSRRPTTSQILNYSPVRLKIRESEIVEKERRLHEYARAFEAELVVDYKKKVRELQQQQQQVQQMQQQLTEFEGELVKREKEIQQQQQQQQQQQHQQQQATQTSSSADARQLATQRLTQLLTSSDLVPVRTTTSTTVSVF